MPTRSIFHRGRRPDRKSTRLNSSHSHISYAVFCLKKNTLPPNATAYPGFDVLTHALESYTSRPYNARPQHTPDDRPVYVGSNPISDIWCEKALEYLGRYFRRAVLNGMDVEARTHMALAATFAGIGFGNAGVHVPHSIAYPIAGLVKNFTPPDYPRE